MEDQTEAQARALEPTLGNAASPASRRAVEQLARLPPALKKRRLACYARSDLGNLEGAARSLKTLLTGGADVRLADKSGDTALHLAAWKGDTACIVLLLDAGAPLEAKASSDGRTPLGVAAFRGHVDAVAALLQGGADANCVDRIGNRPISEAVVNQDLHCVELLLPHSNLSVTNHQGHHDLHTCVLTASYDCFKLLLPHVADVDVYTVPGVDANGEAQLLFNMTAAHIACRKGQHKMLERLLRRGASRTARDNMHATPLHYAAVHGELSCIVQLIGHPEAYKMAPADVNAANENGFSPLHYAAHYGHAKICGLLIAAGARLDALARIGGTPLMTAQLRHPANTALLDLLAGRGPEHPPGTTCDRCGCPEDPASHLMPCSGCQVARYCSVACQHAAWAAHKSECGLLKAKREESTRAVIV